MLICYFIQFDNYILYIYLILNFKMLVINKHIHILKGLINNINYNYHMGDLM